jgi:protein-tyrosine sulfotransferase
MASQPLFIISGPRSGSTLLRYILDSHSRIASPGEIALGMLCTQLEYTIRSTIGEAMRSSPPGERQDKAVALTREIVDRVMGAYLALKDKQIWCDKTVTNLEDLAILTAVFPDARFICLYRDSLDFVHSCLECSRLGYMHTLADFVARQPHNLVGAMMSAWVQNTTRLLDFERKHPDRCFRIRYEDLVTAPEEFLRPLLGFAGVDWEDDLLASVFTRPHDQGGGDPKILVSNRIDPTRVGVGAGLDVKLIPQATRLAADELSSQLSYPALTAGRRLPWLAGEEAAQDDHAASASELIAAALRDRLRDRAELAATMQGTCRLVLQGHGGGSWKLDLGGGAPALVADEGAADCSLTASVADFQAVIAGHLNPVAALWDRRLKVEGDPAIAANVGKLLGR